MKGYIKSRVKTITYICVILLFISVIPQSHEVNAKEGQSTYTGKGVRVAIIDSGIDVTHEDLKNNIVGGYDFVENKPIYRDGDLEKGHGTHVSGIVAGNGKITGVAKDASLLVYRVLSKDEHEFEENIIKAIERAIDDKAQVINISLKTPITGLNSKIEETVKKANDKGIVVIKSNGNYGPKEWTTKDLATSPYVISVANCSGIMEEPVIIFKDQKIFLNKVVGSKEFPEVLNEQIFYIDIATAEDLQNYEIKDRVIFIKTEKAYIEDIAHKAKELGAKGLIIGSPKSIFEPIPIYDEELSVPTASVYGEELKKVESIIKNRVYIFKERVESISKDSSRGIGIENFNLKPDICAPGVGIVSAVPKDVSESGYAINTGTSMSAPYITGVVALIKEAHPNWTVDQIKSSLMNNADVLLDRHGKPYNVIAQGAGKVNPTRTINTDIFIEPASLSFPIISEEEKSVSMEKKLTIETIDDNVRKYSVRVELENEMESIKIEHPKEVFLRADRKVNMKIKVTVDKGNEKIGNIGGRIYLEDNKDRKVVPFVVSINPENYPLITSFQVESPIISPNKDGVLEEVGISYNVPRDITDLKIWAKNIDSGESIDIIARENLKGGFYNEAWQGISIDNKGLKDGVYGVNIDVSNGKWSTNISGNNVLIIDTESPSINMKIVNEDIYGNIEDNFITKSYLIDNINRQNDSDLEAVKVYYSTDNRNNYKKIELDEEGKFHLSLDNNSYKSIYVKAIDACGNSTIKKFYMNK